MFKKIAIFSSAAFILILAGCSSIGNKYNELAQCLTDKKVEMYGTFWCPYCAKQKKAFGKAFDYITYVECDPRGQNPEPDRCLEKKIEGYPTWIFPDGERLTGGQKPEDLARKVNCPLPQEEL